MPQPSPAVNKSKEPREPREPKETHGPDAAPVPRHIAIIMDGNGRWANRKGLARLSGHEHGAEAVRGSLEACRDLGVEYLTLYAFSTENWKRPKNEISGLMGLLERFLKKEAPRLGKEGVRITTIGRTGDLPASTRKELQHAMKLTERNRRTTLILALSYSSRVEITDAVQAIAREVQAGTLDPGAIDAEMIGQHLYTRDIPDPDLLIRTSGEMRLSNFLLWQLSYTEIYVTPKLWPDFRREDLLEAVEDYRKRHRRFGAV